jgi:hypothetical protein
MLHRGGIRHLRRQEQTDIWKTFPRDNEQGGNSELRQGKGLKTQLEPTLRLH